MKCRMLLLIITVACAIGLSSAPAEAGSSCLEAEYLFPGQATAFSLGSPLMLEGSQYFRARISRGHSYAVMVWSPSLSRATLPFLEMSFYGDSACTLTPGVQASGPDPGPLASEGATRSLISGLDGQLYIHVLNKINSSYPIDVLFVETTLFSPWWFTGGSNQAYVEVTNTTASATNAVLTLRRSNGTVCGAANISLPAGGNAALEVNAIGDCAASLSGSAAIAFNGTPGGLAANITTINVATGTSFDSPFTPRLWGTFSRPR